MDENFQVIVDPETNKAVPIQSAIGQQVIKNYIECIKNGPDSKNIISTSIFYKKTVKSKKQIEKNQNEGSIRGVCPICKKNVLTTHERVKVSGKYYHEKCYSK
tara:strand:+ start:192 stop:500 length:309 start_codon:yes stop_codon:yes gene_type:complete